MKKRLFLTTALITLSFSITAAMAEDITERQVINSGEERAFNNATANGISNPDLSGGVIKNAGTVDINDSDFTNNSARYGSVIYNSNILNIGNSSFENNHADVSAGAIYNSFNGIITITGNTTFSGNTHSPNAGGTICNDIFNVGVLNLKPDEGKTIFFGSGIDGDGGNDHGTINIDGKGRVRVENELIYHDVNLNSGTLELAPTASVEATRIAIKEGANFSVNNTEFKNNHADGKYGGAISRDFEDDDDDAPEGIDMSNLNFENNTAKHGGAISNRRSAGHASDSPFLAGPTVIENSIFYGNEAEYNGGAIYNEGIILIENSEFVGNKTGDVQAYGGAIYNETDAILTINNSDFKDNKAASSGGAIHNRGTVAIGGNSTFSGNGHAPNTGKYIANDIYNTGYLYLLPDTDETISFAGGIDGEGEGGFVGVYGNGKVSISNELAYQDVMVLNGTLELLPDTNVKASHIEIIMYEDAPTFNATGVSFTEQMTTEDGGVLYSDGIVNIKDSEFKNNTLTTDESNYGGAILNDRDMTISGTRFIGNKIVYNESALSDDDDDDEDEDEGINNKGGAVYNYALMSISKSEFTDNEIIADGDYNYGGAINNKFGFLTIEDTTFNNNKLTGDWTYNYGGAVNNSDGEVTISNSTFKGNFITSICTNYGGAIHNENGGEITISNSTFTENRAIGQDNSSGIGGAIANEAGQITITNSTFEKNESAGSAVSSGGAIYIGGKVGDEGQSLAIVKIFDSTFKNNISSWGGAIDNSGELELTNVSFIENIAEYKNPDFGGVGGALRNYWTTTIKDGTFIGNTAFMAGAIYNEGNMEITGNTVFEGNKASGNLNDIHNEGKIKVSGDLTLDGGITGYSASVPGKITFAEGSNLTVETGTTTITNNIVQNEGATLHMQFDNGYSGQYVLISDGSVLDNEFTIADNTLYNITATETKGTYDIDKKSEAEIAEQTGASPNEAAVIAAITNGNSDNASFNAIADNISNLMQSDAAGIKTALEAVETLAPESDPVFQQTQMVIINQAFEAVGSRFNNSIANSNVKGRSGGDVFKEGDMWVQGLVNHAKLDNSSQNNGFKSDTYGIALGVERKFEDSVKAGVGYAYNETDVDDKKRDIEVKTHSALIYAEYKPSNWFVNGIASYSWSKYKEKKNVIGTRVHANYGTETFGLQALTGYNFLTKYATLTPQIGMRYIHVEQEGYTDSISQHVLKDTSNIVTGLMGSKISKDFKFDNDFVLTPEAKFMMTYDIKRENVAANVVLPNGSSYTVNGNALKRFGIEVGTGLTAEFSDNIEVSLNYEGKFKKDYQDHSGLLNFKYKF